MKPLSKYLWFIYIIITDHHHHHEVRYIKNEPKRPF